MLISRGQLIAGMPAADARNLMRSMRDVALSVGVVGQIMGVSDERARSVIEDLAGAGFLRSVRLAESYRFRIRDDEDGAAGTKNAVELWETTIAGNALAKARLGTPMSRQKAQALLDGLISRAATVNEDSASAFTVERIEVFGSFTEPSRSEVGDVDVHLVFDRRVDGDRFIELASQAADAAEAEGRRFGTLIARLGHIEIEFQRYLRGRSQRLDIQFDAVGHASLLPPGVITEVVYRRAAERRGG